MNAQDHQLPPAPDKAFTKPFDPDTLPPHLRAGLDQVSEICLQFMIDLAAHRAATAAATAATAHAS